MQSWWLLSLAHVKWFTGVMPGEPEPAREVVNVSFLAAFALVVVTMVVLTRLNQPLQRLEWVERIHARLDLLKPYTVWLIRIGLAVPLLFAGFQGYLFHYELVQIPFWASAAQVVLGVLVLAPKLDRFAAAAIAVLYAWGAGHFGIHPLIDYISWLGACYYLVVRGTPFGASAIPMLYITTGLSLSWAAIEKWVYPHMALDIIAHHGIPTFGFPPVLFLMLAGWVELGVGYLLITGVLNRFLSLVVTGLFVLTSAVFGAKEIVGHWQLHAVLLVFLAEGTGNTTTPVLWHRGEKLQMAFVGVTLIPFVIGLMALYYLL